MPLAPRLAWALAVGPPNHSRSRTGIDEATTRRASAGRRRAIVRATPGSVSCGCPASTSSMAASARRAASVHPARQAGSAGPRGATPASCVGRQACSSRRDRGRWCPARRPGSRRRRPRRQPPSTGRGPWRPPGGRHGRSRPAGGRRRNPGPGAARRTARSPRRAGASPMSGRPAPASPAAAARAATSAGATPLRPPARITPRRPSTPSAIEHRSPGHGLDAAVTGRRQRTDRPDERLPERQVEVHRPVGGRLEHTAGQRSPRRCQCGVGDAGVVEPADRPAVQVGLIDGLRGARRRAARAGGRR